MDAPAPTEEAEAARLLRIGTQQQFRWLEGIVKAVLVMNLLDAILTLFWVRAGLAREANTLLDELVSDDALLFVAVKLSLVGMGSWLLWRRRSSPVAVVAIFVAFVAYYAILVQHVSYASGLLGLLLSR